jgi:transcriptional regulator with XRE-family HTH domain
MLTQVAQYAISLVMEKHPVKQYRQDNGLTLDEFAAMFSTPVSKFMVSRWENGVTPIPHDLLVDVANKLNVPVEALLPTPRPHEA